MLNLSKSWKMIRAAAIFGKSTSEEGVAATVLGHVWYQEYPTQPARYCFVLFTPRVPKYWLNDWIMLPSQPHPEWVHVWSYGSLGSCLCEGFWSEERCQHSVQVSICIFDLHPSWYWSHHDHHRHGGVFIFLLTCANIRCHHCHSQSFAVTNHHTIIHCHQCQC